MKKGQQDKKQHKADKAKVQALLNLLLSIADDQGFKKNTDQVLSAAGEEIYLELEIQDFIPKYKIDFLSAVWRVGEGGAEYISFEFSAKTGKVADSTKFTSKGKYKGQGHIQCAHSHLDNELAFIEEVIALLELLDGTWSLISSLDRKFPD